ncbi:unnamed protein product [Arabis nemorensis]|uniref:Uncharacterized protein n=1 Tax=Arabis nemorensis TaxID=586526 RepID=A0A565C0H0_9BRAS|nr:unnamed protein product [Arabis nemorensis]
MNEEKDDANPLVVQLDDGDAQTKEEIPNQWFSQDIFSEAVEEGDLRNDDEMQIEKQRKTLAKPDKSKQKASKASVLSDQSVDIVSVQRQRYWHVPR